RHGPNALPAGAGKYSTKSVLFHRLRPPLFESGSPPRTSHAIIRLISACRLSRRPAPPSLGVAAATNPARSPPAGLGVPVATIPSRASRPRGSAQKNGFSAKVADGGL